MANFVKSVSAGIVVIVVSTIIIEKCRQKGWI